MSSFARERAAVSADGRTEAVTVNQRALIDKILARYCTAHSVYRELLQNSNDACARRAEIRFLTANDGKVPVVEGVVYRNDGNFFSEADFARLTCIAAGNPNPEKIGAFGVGAYSLFSICSSPLLLSGLRSLLFEWDGDSLVAKHGTRPAADAKSPWTAFELPAREPYKLPDLVDFGAFLASALAFTTHLTSAEVFVNDASVLSISKRFPSAPVGIKPPVENTWWNRNSIILHSPSSLFSLAAHDGALTDTAVEIVARYGPNTSATEALSARIISTDVSVDCSPVMQRRMERVTKKSPMRRFPLRLLFGDADGPSGADGQSLSVDRRRARAMLEQFAPRVGAGQLYIGFRTSQTTGLAVHLAGPFLPTVEREAVDLVDPTLAVWNGELLFISGVLMRLALEHSMMSRVGRLWKEEASQRVDLERLRLDRIRKTAESALTGAQDIDADHRGEESGKARNKNSDGPLSSSLSKPSPGSPAEGGKKGTFFSGFASFMQGAASEVKRIAVSVVESVSDDPSNLLAPLDPQQAPSRAELEATVLMRSFVPTRSTPDSRVGAEIAKGFEGCLPNLAAPVLTTAGVVRGTEACTAHLGMEGFVAYGSDVRAALVRSVVLANAADYVKYVCRTPQISVGVLAAHLKTRVLMEDETLLLISWFMLYARKEVSALESLPHLKNSVNVCFTGCSKSSRLCDFLYVASAKGMCNVPLQPGTLPVSFSNRLPDRVLRDSSFSAWFAPLSRTIWSDWILDHECLTAERSPENDATRLAVFSCLAGELFMADEDMRIRDSGRIVSRLKGTLGTRKCLPIEGGGLERPVDTYLPIPELEIFSGVTLAKVCTSVLRAPNITQQFLATLGVREAVSLDILFTELDRLTWTQDPTGLVQYLCSMQSKLSPAEIRRLRESQFLPSTVDQDLHAPPELVLPLAELKQLPFVPFLRWRGPLSSKSDEAIFLSSVLGIRAAPTLESLLRVAADEKTSPSIHRKCVEISAARLDGNVDDGDFRMQPEDKLSLLRDYSFLPCKRIQPVPGWVLEGDAGQSSKLCSPKDCFTDRSCSVAGFWVVDSDFEISASRFKVEREPSGSLYTRALVKIVGAAIARPVESDEMRHVLVWRLFEFLATRMGCFSYSDKKVLRSTAFVPIWASSKDDGNVKSLVWRRPGDVYFDSRSSSMSSVTSCLFETVATNEFLRFAGVKDEPSLSDLCDLIVLNPEKVFSKMRHDQNRYGELLHRIAAQLSSQSPSLVNMNALLNQLKRTPFLLATKFVDTAATEAAFVNEEADQAVGDQEGEAVSVQKVTWVLARPDSIFIVDDTLLQRMFNPLSLPNELSTLESFYRQLGSAFLSTAVSRQSEIPRQGHGAYETELARELKSRILQRRILILETSNRPLAGSAARILSADSLHVKQISRISSICTLKGTRKVQPVTCCSNQGLNGRPPASLPLGAKLILYITEDLDFFDVADALGRQLFQRCGLQDVFLLAQLLETTLAQLRARGFPVDKIRSIAAPVPPASSPTEEPIRVQQAVPSSSADHNVRSAGPDGFKDILKQIFPDADPQWISRQLALRPGQDGLRYVKDLMQKDGYDKIPADETTCLTEKPSPPQVSEKPKSEGLKNVSSLLRAFKKRSAGRAGTGRGRSGPGAALPGPIVDTLDQSVDSNDALNHDGIRSALNSAVRASTAVPASGVSSPETQSVVQDPTSSQTPSCEIIPGQSLTSVARGGQQRSKTSHGIRVFVSRLGGRTEQSLQFCLENWAVVERFSFLLNDLGKVFRLDVKSVAIFYSDVGRTIAFNSNGSLFFNLRYYLSLHGGQSRPSVDAWMFWYTTFCHELAHNLARSHDQKHGFYTESMVTEHFSRFLDHLRDVGL